MARQTGLIHSLRRITRVVIVGLAALLLVALWMNYSKEPELPPADDIAVLPGQDAATTAETDEPVTEEATTETPVETAEAAVGEAKDAAANLAEAAQGAAEEAKTTAEEAVAGVKEAVQGAVDQAQGTADAAVAEAKETAQNAINNALGAVQEAAPAAEAAAGALDMALPPVSGDEGSYRLDNAVLREDGSLEVTSTRTDTAGSVTSVRRITCDPLQAGLIAEGDGPRNETPEMVAVEAGKALALIAEAACGTLE